MKSNFKAFKQIFIQLNSILNKKQKWGSAVVLCSMLICSGMELLGVSTIYPFLQLMLEPEKLSEKWYVQQLEKISPDVSFIEVLIVMCVAIIVIYILKNCFMLLGIYIQNAYAAKLQKEISIEVLNSYLRRPYQFFLNTNSSVIIRGIGFDVGGVYQILLHCFTILAEIVNVLALGVFLFMIDIFITVSAMLLALICFIAIIYGFKGKMKRAGEEIRQASALKSMYSYQAITGIKEITVLDRRENFVEKYGKVAEVEERLSCLNGFINACPDRILEGVCIAGFMGIVCVEILRGIDLNTFIPVIGTFAVGAFRILPSISKISSRLNAMVFYRPCLQSTYDNFQEIKEWQQCKENRGREDTCNSMYAQHALARPNFQKEIEIKNIFWKYLNTKDYVLQNLSLTIHKGEAVAFIGASGAGKTTLADVIMGLLRPQMGSVKADGNEIFEMPHLWSQMIGYVPQSVFLIDDTVRSNVAFGLEKEVISDELVWEALQQAQLKGFVENLPEGLDTIVGERGVKFSGGQRQRIAIARALYENPDIIVLDEATSALDNETESAVMEAIDALQGYKTLIIVAHRLTTIRNCDTVYEIKNGVAVEKSKDEVLKEVSGEL